MTSRCAAILVTLSFCAPSAAALLSAEEKTVDAPGWEKDLAKARTLARKTKRPIFLVFR
ncbi:MAG: hypothetical protein ACE5KM_12050 [Planctomycetaceae bacterium]